VHWIPFASLEWRGANARALPRQRTVGLLPGVDAALDMAGGLQTGILRRLHRHGRALAEGTVEHDALAGRRRELLQHAAGANMFR
jgi:hypothetical protein